MKKISCNVRQEITFAKFFVALLIIFYVRQCDYKYNFKLTNLNVIARQIPGKENY